ncbi:MAG: DNA-processing protein DprA [Candidatus Eremiobacteraeota bacterium]|nr:DNA-processing protein DprA [Candidatus Eremiobacteraeota bacterium]
MRPGRTALARPLWLCGALDGLAAPAVAIVGTRAPSGAGRRLAFECARDLAEAGCCIVSGLALGIDAAAHEGALAGGGMTIGVLGGGHRRFFPRANRGLAERIVRSGGGVVSPFAPDHAAFPAQFLQRNAIVAALADGVVVVEAAARSGALNTASHGADLGIPVMAFPGDVDRPKVAGCLALLRDGATLVRDARDVAEALGLACARSRESGPNGEALDPRDRAVIAALRDGEVAFETLVGLTGAAAGELAARLVALELAGLVESRTGARYALS